MASSIFNKTNAENCSFENNNFNTPIIESNIEHFGSVIFKNCKFFESFTFENLKCKKLSFHNCEFKKPICFFNSEFIEISMHEVLFLDSVEFLNLNLKHSFDFKWVNAQSIVLNGDYKEILITDLDCKILDLRNLNGNNNLSNNFISIEGESNIEKINVSSISNYGKFIFSKGNFGSITFTGFFYDSLSFNNIIVKDYLIFESCNFENRLDFQECNFYNFFIFRSTFKSLINFKGYDILEMKSLDLLIESLYIHNCTFEQNIDLENVNLKMLNISNNNFKQLFTFNNKIDKNFINLTINGTNMGNISFENINTSIDFQDVNFANIYFRNLNISFLTFSNFHNKGYISFNSIKSGIYFSIVNSITGNLNLLNENINHFKEIVIANSNLTGLEINVFPKIIRSYSVDPKIGFGLENKSQNNFNLKTVYNQLKQIALKIGDIDSAFKFQSLEFKKHIVTRKFGWDTILLSLNFISNNNGQSWIRGIIFTISISLIFFSIYINLTSSNLKFDVFLKDFIQFFCTFPKLELEKYENANKKWNTTLIIWFARIFIGYGIYQTVAAFRKFGKNF